MRPLPRLAGLAPETAYRIGQFEASYRAAHPAIKSAFQHWLLAYGWSRFSTEFRLFDRSGVPQSLTQTNAAPERRFYCQVMAQSASHALADCAFLWRNITSSSLGALAFGQARGQGMLAMARDRLSASPIRSVEDILALCAGLKAEPDFAEPINDFSDTPLGTPLPYGAQADYGGAWAVNVALATSKGVPDYLGGIPLVGLVSRQCFRTDFAVERAGTFVQANIQTAVDHYCAALERLVAARAEFDKHLRSSGEQSSTFEIWMLINAVGAMSHAQASALTSHNPSSGHRALKRLANAALVALQHRHYVAITPLPRLSASTEGLDGADYTAFDRDMAEIDALLEKYDPYAGREADGGDGDQSG